jgi:cobyrinic acid a,c-diamide synthase
MYLGEQIQTQDGKSFDMAGVISIKTVMNSRLRALGYREVYVETETSLFEFGDRFKGHEFHYSDLIPKSDLNFSYRTIGSTGRTGRDGVYIKNTLASYAHIHFGSNPEAAKRIPGIIKRRLHERL